MSHLEGKLNRGLVLVAEGYVFELARRCLLSRGAFVPEVVLDYPEAVEGLHREFARAGSDVILALTYYAHEAKMARVGRVNDLQQINVQAVQIARKVAREFEGTLVAGNICNTGVYDPDNADSTGEEVRRMYSDQISWVAGDLDYVAAETIRYFGEALIAHEVISSFGLPSVITLSSHPVTTSGTDKNMTHDGYSIAEACKRLEDAGALVVGLNCTRGPKTMLPVLKKIRQQVGGNLAALPVPYRTSCCHPTFWDLRRKGKKREQAFPENLDPHLLDLTEIADFAKCATDLGVNYLGLCCGASPEMFRAMAVAVGRSPQALDSATDMERHYRMGSDVEPFNEET